jgi:hypothetical protein
VRVSAAAAVSVIAPLAVLLPVFWVLGGFTAHQRAEVLLLGLISAAATRLFTAWLRRGGPLALLRWVVFSLLVAGYPLQLYWLVLDPDVALVAHGAVTDALSPDRLLQAFWLSTGSLLVAAVLANLLDAVPVRRPRGEAPDPSAQAGRLALAGALLLAPPLLWVMATYRIGVMGGDLVVLPYRLAGWTIWTVRVLVPALLLFAAFAGERLGRPALTRTALAAILAVAALDLLTTTSKAGLVMAFLQPLLLFAFMGRLDRRRMQFAALALAGLAALFPLFTALRWERVSGADVTAALDAVRAGRAGDDALLGLLRPAGLRLTGVAYLLPALPHPGPRPDLVLEGFSGGFGVSRFASETVFGHDRDFSSRMAPGLLGWFYLAGGRWAVLPGLVLFLCVIEGLWRLLLYLRLRTGPVALAMLAAFLLTVLSDGVLEAMALPLAALAATTAGLELLARLGAGREGAQERPVVA